MGKLTPSERQAGFLMSDLFLDTQIDEGDYDRIANKLCDLEMHLDLNDLEKLFWEDLFPAKIWNLVQVDRSGEWGGFDEDEVCDDVEEYRAGCNWFEKTVVLRVNWLLWSSKVNRLWNKLKARLHDVQERRRNIRHALPTAQDHTFLAHLIRLEC
ncbi:hypothetical protein CC80DRAFT_552595 [Byssothecium circinans]|uniref:DUF7079 domain-containing protein n=1 Tax=Byssothecium circinans TaxID=147558 RepID=A0A6A5TH31_9PLEO|nr:hypothetical protein CC80DRAFT_552595 [Byssothecium circinans]